MDCLLRWRGCPDDDYLGDPIASGPGWSPGRRFSFALFLSLSLSFCPCFGCGVGCVLFQVSVLVGVFFPLRKL